MQRMHWRGTRSIWHSQALASTLPYRAATEPSAPAPATLLRAFPYTPEPVALTVSPRLRTVLPSFRAIQSAGGHTRVLLCQNHHNTATPCFHSCSCTSPLTLLLPPLPLVRVSLASLARQPTPSGRRRTGCQRTHLRPPSPQQQTGS